MIASGLDKSLATIVLSHSSRLRNDCSLSIRANRQISALPTAEDFAAIVCDASESTTYIDSLRLEVIFPYFML